ncbi:F-type H+-transporting ATPase subunit b [Luteibacter sp. UNCMF331Sha3.1]|jgi:F-type H+-transporting ATPase subunit b|uniref:F0F1 ATP synthase subunit B n=1 Tax=unclassified Luteibacter TaxID=2620188 RepID=UPI0008D603A0|nr:MULTISPECIES: F0F1 ATP synthase subunit B [unclassified Luteibacter]MDR6937746.1 F-type H+-transporting ATPase subunit b [Luteibacter sp. 3190]SEM48050.1 F-type H+-transporting ATPase subunit b [Luteibacter sp. UNCMF331Sha3.1]SEO40143.1 F-type H+-transporting ATPase subunit b [Luteibacter sp. UNC138MFCol5.1]SEW27508.1 F-type H+-transporting ATPase subunit b [Luteibacter sp. 329MFSha]
MEINMTFLGQMISFAILVWFTTKFIWPQLNGAIEERQKKVAEGLAAAERARAELKDADAKVAIEIKQARQQSTEIIDRAQAQANQIIEKARAEAIDEINRLKASAQDEIASMAQRAREQLREQVGALAVKGAEKIVQREIDPAAHKALLDQLAAEI